MERKAQAQVITTILIILLVLAVIVIVWQVVRGTVETGAGEIGKAAECLNVELTIDEVIGTSVKVSRGAGGGTITGVRIVVDGVVKSPDEAALAPLATGTYTITAPTESVKVAAIIGDTICPVSDTQKIA